jgi:hypothetical protein
MHAMEGWFENVGKTKFVQPKMTLKMMTLSLVS